MGFFLLALRAVIFCGLAQPKSIILIGIVDCLVNLGFTAQKALFILQSERAMYMCAKELLSCNNLESRMIPFQAGYHAFSSLKQKSFSAVTSKSLQ